MGSIVDGFDWTYRDYETGGVPATGGHEPLKHEIRALGELIEAAIGLGLGDVSVVKTTKALLDADLAHAADTLAIVYADATKTNNDLYVKVGASGAGSWTNTGALNAAFLGQIVAERKKVPSPFLADVSNEYLRSIVKDFYVEGGDSADDGRYILNFEVLNLGAGNGRFTLKLRDRMLGLDMAQWQKIDTQANLAARTSPTIVGFQGALAGYSGITFTAWIDWTKLTDWTVALTSYTTAAESGLRGDRVYTQDDIDEFRYRADPKIVLTVGAGATSATHFNTRAAAIASLYIPGLTVTRSGPFPLSDICSFSNQVLILDVDDGIDEVATLTNIAGVDQSTVVLPPFITLRGRGPSSRFRANNAANNGPVIEAPFPFGIEDMTIENQQSGYCVHIDNNNDRAKRSTVVGDRVVLRYRMISRFVRATLKGSASTVSWLAGVGLSNGHYLGFDRCRFIGAANQPQLGVHTSTTTTDPGEIEVRDTYFNDTLFGTAIQLIKNVATTIQHWFNVKGSDLADITVGNTGGGSAGFIRTGKIDSAITIGGTLDT